MDSSAMPAAGQLERSQLTRAVIASTIGTSIEWYDFFLYSTVTGLVFAKLYLPQQRPDRRACSRPSWCTRSASSRGRSVRRSSDTYGDRIGRKATLIATLLLMGIATFLVGFVPGYASIGIWGAITLTVLRFIQGVGVGGEWGGSVLLSMEWARTNKNRGLIASWPQFGVPAGLFLANLAVLGFSALSGPAFLDWGWRIPFFLSIILVGIGLYIRMGVMETPVFRRLVEENKIERAPVSEVLRLQWREVLLSSLVRMSEQAPFYIFTSFIFSYGTAVLAQPRDFLITAVLVGAIGSAVWIPLFGAVSDRYGRKRTYMLGSAVTLVFGFLYFSMLNTGMPALIFLAIFLSLIPHDIQYGPQAAFIAESFTPRLRYSGASIGYQLASVFAGGPAPLIAAWLFATYHSWMAIAIYIAGCSVVTLLACLGMKDHTGAAIDAEYEHTPVAPARASIA